MYVVCFILICIHPITIKRRANLANKLRNKKNRVAEG